MRRRMVEKEEEVVEVDFIFLISYFLLIWLERLYFLFASLLLGTGWSID